jgi:hypothetical protein
MVEAPGNRSGVSFRFRIADRQPRMQPKIAENPPNLK